MLHPRQVVGALSLEGGSLGVEQQRGVEGLGGLRLHLLLHQHRHRHLHLHLHGLLELRCVLGLLSVRVRGRVCALHSAASQRATASAAMAIGAAVGAGRGSFQGRLRRGGGG